MLYRRTFLSLGPLALAGLAGCATRPPGDSSPADPADAPGPSAMTDEQALEASLQAMALVGIPYRYGGNTPQGGFDCSGLIGYVYRRAADIAPPRTVREISGWGQPVATAHLRTGDLVIFGGGRVATHAGIHIGQSRFVHAPSTGGTVRLNSVHERYWAARLIGYRRPLA